MGALQASEMVRLTDTETALRWHLQSNHYPPVPSSMVTPCLEAIDAYREEDYRRSIELPCGITWRGQTSAPASAFVDGYHLQAFLLEDNE